MNTWNRERKRTRDRLLAYDFSILPPYPQDAGLAMIYPWDDLVLEQLNAQLYILASNSGFTGSEQDFIERFGEYLSKDRVIFSTLTTFPLEGDPNLLYFDIDTKILYYWDDTYQPVNSLLIAETILNAGKALEIGDDYE